MKHGRPQNAARQAPAPPTQLEHRPTCRCHSAHGCAGHLWTSLVDQSGKAWHVDPMCTASSAETA
jgi:hypothetical protein